MAHLYILLQDSLPPFIYSFNKHAMPHTGVLRVIVRDQTWFLYPKRGKDTEPSPIWPINSTIQRVLPSL